MNEIKNKAYDEERALYNLEDTLINNCTFAGPKDGESALKESRNIKVINSHFLLRYPLWHNLKYTLQNSVLEKTSRAPLWYSHDGLIENCKILSVKALRECSNTEIINSIIHSPEFGWKCHDIKLSDCTINSKYIFLDSNNISINNLKFTGKYSFQYNNNLSITNSFLNTKDAFWHSKNVTIKYSIIKGEYLAWFSENLTLENCKIIGTQPFCYCENLKLINCEMLHCDLAFEYSSVSATINGHIDSIKNPKSGKIIAGSIGSIIKEDSIMEDTCKIIINGEKHENN